MAVWLGAEKEAARNLKNSGIGNDDLIDHDAMQFSLVDWFILGNLANILTGDHGSKPIVSDAMQFNDIACASVCFVSNVATIWIPKIDATQFGFIACAIVSFLWKRLSSLRSSLRLKRLLTTLGLQ